MTNDELFQANTRLAYKIASKYLRNYSNEYEDIKQIALIALWKATKTFDNKHKFSVYAGKIISNEINRYIQKVKKDKVLVSMSQEVGNSMTIEDTLYYEEDFIANIENKYKIQTVFSKTSNILTKKEQMVLMKILQGKKQQEIGEELGVKRNTISMIYKNIKQKLKNKLEENDYER